MNINTEASSFLSSTRNVAASDSVQMPEFPAIAKACERLTDLICKPLPRVLPEGVTAFAKTAVEKIIKDDVLHLKNLILKTIDKGHKSFSSVCQKFREASGIKSFVHALANMLQWAVGKGLSLLAHACALVLGMLSVVNKVTIDSKDIDEFLSQLKKEFKTVANFEIHRDAIVFSQAVANDREVNQTDETSTAILHSQANSEQNVDEATQATTSDEETQTRSVQENDGSSLIEDALNNKNYVDVETSTQDLINSFESSPLKELATVISNSPTLSTQQS